VEQEGKQGKSLLFVNKKKQKNFIHLHPWAPIKVDESFLVLFFKKERACLPAFAPHGQTPPPCSNFAKSWRNP
jgi:hypothetical protein